MTGILDHVLGFLLVRLPSLLIGYVLPYAIVALIGLRILLMVIFPGRSGYMFGQCLKAIGKGILSLLMATARTVAFAFTSLFRALLSGRTGRQ